MMDYLEVIQHNIERNSKVSWWPRFAYHYTDITNAVHILSMGRLFSRATAEKLGIMNNDNASRQVIDMTNADAKQDVRFYFRPLTPTQYHNEGYKHPSLRYSGDLQANCPVPIFLLFELSTFLNLPGVAFSETSRAGHPSEMLSGPENFSKLDFEKIYAKGPMVDANIEKAYRQAELAHPSPMLIDTCIRHILCRNEFEQSMLLTMLRKEDNTAFKRYQPIIKVCKSDMFECNGLYVEDCIFHQNNLSISFVNSSMKFGYTTKYRSGKLTPVTGKLELDWIKTNRGGKEERIYHASAVTSINYDKPIPLSFRLPAVQNAKKLEISLFIDDRLMCYKEQSLDEPYTVF